MIARRKRPNCFLLARSNHRWAPMIYFFVSNGRKGEAGSSKNSSSFSWKKFRSTCGRQRGRSGRYKIVAVLPDFTCRIYLFLKKNCLKWSKIPVLPILTNLWLFFLKIFFWGKKKGSRQIVQHCHIDVNMKHQASEEVSKIMYCKTTQISDNAASQKWVNNENLTTLKTLGKNIVLRDKNWRQKKSDADVTFHVQGQVIGSGEGPFAQLTLERPVARVFAVVASQFVAACEFPSAIFPGALVRFFTCWGKS